MKTKKVFSKIKGICLVIVIIIFTVIMIKGDIFLYTEVPTLLWTRYSVEDIQQKVDNVIKEMRGENFDRKDKQSVIPNGLYSKKGIRNIDTLKGKETYAYCDYLIRNGKDSAYYKWYQMTYNSEKNRSLMAYNQLMEIEESLKEDEDPCIKMAAYQQSFWWAGWKYLFGDDSAGPLATCLGNQVISYVSQEKFDIYRKMYEGPLLMIQLLQATDEKKKELLRKCNYQYFSNVYKGVFYADMGEYELATSCLTKRKSASGYLLEGYIFFSQHDDIDLSEKAPFYNEEVEELLAMIYSNQCIGLYQDSSDTPWLVTESHQIDSMIYYYVYGRYYESMGDRELAKENFTQMLFQGLPVIRFPKIKEKLEEYGILEIYAEDIIEAQNEFLNRCARYPWLFI